MINDIIGVLGLAFLLGGFLLNELKKIKSESLVYNVSNLFGAAFLGYYSFILGSNIFVVLNSIWGIVAAIKVAKALISSK